MTNVPLGHFFWVPQLTGSGVIEGKTGPPDRYIDRFDKSLAFTYSDTKVL